MTIKVTTLTQWKKIREDLQGRRIGFVPTMGALHAGHASLLQASRHECDVTIASIFVNPTQFNDPEDFKKYPRTDEVDANILRDCGVHYLFSPRYEDMYPDQFHYKVSENALSQILCGAHRPGHFDGVLTVVMKLFQIIQPDFAYFGEKDYQQLKLIEGMVKAFFMPLNLRACPTIREPDGLAMSSRNVRLTSEGRVRAALFAKLLKSAKSLSEIRAELETSGFQVDYIEEHFGRRFGAVYVDGVRLIDNVPVKAGVL